MIQFSKKAVNLWLRVSNHVLSNRGRVHLASEGRHSHNYFLTPEEAEGLADALKQSATAIRNAKLVQRALDEEPIVEGI